MTDNPENTYTIRSVLDHAWFEESGVADDDDSGQTELLDRPCPERSIAFTRPELVATVPDSQVHHSASNSGAQASANAE